MPSAAVVVRGDPNRLRQVVWHLLANAIKFTPRGGSIDVAARVGRRTRCVTVRDSGPGIDARFPAADLRALHAGGLVADAAAGGLGVGLSLVRELVERHGGEIQARNRDDGGARSSRCSFPLHRVDQTVRQRLPARRAARRSARPPLDGLRVLLLDRDRGRARAVQRRAASSAARRCRSRRSVDEALEMLESWRPDVLVSDAVSPERDVYALVGKVQSLEADRGGRIPARGADRR